MAAPFSNVPKEFLRVAEAQLLPPRVGHNWNDPAFRKKQNKPQQLEGEFRGKRVMPATNGNFNISLPENIGESAHQLLHALSTKNRGALNGKATAQQPQKRCMTLSDKVLRFYAFFREQAPEGGANDFWHRKVMIDFFLEDDTVLIQEPQIPNSGMEGGTFLKRQKIKADYRQREQFPDNEYININYFNVGQVIRINSIEFFLYNCDAFTRQFLTDIGVDVGEPVECPDDEFIKAYRSQQQCLQAVSKGEKPFNMVSSSRETQAAEAVRTARFLRDSGKILHFYALLEEPACMAGSDGAQVRKLDILYYVEDDTIAITEQQTGSEFTHSLYLSRCFLPKSGSLGKANELTFAHRLNGVRAPYIGPDAYYTAKDMRIGATINVLGRSILLYDCDEYTRSYYMNHFGEDMQPALSVADRLNPQSMGKTALTHSDKATASDGSCAMRKSRVVPALLAKDTLRFQTALANPKTNEDGFRRFVLTYHTDTNEVAVHEKQLPNSGSIGRCLLKRQELRKPALPHGPRNDPVEKQRRQQEERNGGSNVDVYHEEDFRVGKQVVVNGLVMNLISMDAHTEAYFMGTTSLSSAADYVDRLLAELREFLHSRYGSAAKAFLVFDHNRDGVISIKEFSASLKRFQITQDPVLAMELFRRIQGNSTHAVPYHHLTTKDIMNLLSGKDGASMANHAEVSGEVCSADLNRTAAEEEDTSMAQRLGQHRALAELRARLEGRSLNYVSMFRLASTMPRAYRERRADILTLTNPSRDAVITPVQLRRCVEEILGWSVIQPGEMSDILSYFFPEMPRGLHFRPRDDVLDYSVDLPTFQKRFHDMCLFFVLPNDKIDLKTSVI